MNVSSRNIRDLVVAAGLQHAALVGDAALPGWDATVDEIVFDSRAVRPGALFCCVRGEHADGHAFASAAVAAGAAALLVEHQVAVDVPQVVVPDSRVAMGLLAAALHDQPSRQMTLVGVTGTNGKTTTTQLIADVLEHAGLHAGVIGTLTGVHTTPESPQLQQRLAEHLADGAKAVAMEVSSHALALDRVAGCHFRLAVFTNLGRDHLDLHGTVERYFAAKARLFTPALTERAIVNADDTHGRLLLDAAEIPTEPFSLSDVSDVIVSATHHSYTWRGVRVEVAIGADFNVMNSLAAATACAALGLTPEQIAAGLRVAAPVPGRFEPIVAGQPFAVIVDYAHTPDGLTEALRAARSASPDGQLTVVFGCGGDRDRDKRGPMGAAAASLADSVVVTSDNPRSEDPASVIDAVIGGVPEDYRDRVVIEPDRRRAIALAFQQARAGDVVLIAGKGHETTQTVGAEIIDFDDRAVARSLLAHEPRPEATL